jgi:hypothetical protein
MSLRILDCKTEGENKVLYFVTYGANAKYKAWPLMAIKNDFKIELGYSIFGKGPAITIEKNYKEKVRAGESFRITVDYDKRQKKR